jgi:hypothetical protein
LQKHATAASHPQLHMQPQTSLLRCTHSKDLQLALHINAPTAPTHAQTHQQQNCLNAHLPQSVLRAGCWL